jgi:hypothetical protein
LKKKKHNDVDKVEEINRSIIKKRHKSKARTHKQKMSSSFEVLESNDEKQEGNMQENIEAARKKKALV